MILAVIFSAGWLQSMFAVKATVPGGYSGGHGGVIGRLIGNSVLIILDKWPASFVFLILEYCLTSLHSAFLQKLS